MKRCSQSPLFLQTSHRHVQVAELLSLKARYNVAGIDVPGEPVLKSKKLRKQDDKAASLAVAPAAAPAVAGSARNGNKNGNPWPAIKNYLTVVAGQVCSRLHYGPPPSTDGREPFG